MKISSLPLKCHCVFWFLIPAPRRRSLSSDSESLVVVRRFESSPFRSVAFSPSGLLSPPLPLMLPGCGFTLCSIKSQALRLIEALQGLPANRETRLTREEGHPPSHRREGLLTFSFRAIYGGIKKKALNKLKKRDECNLSAAVHKLVINCTLVFLPSS